MKVYISGGCKNGKSMYAQKIAKNMCAGKTPLYYVATMKPADKEDDIRIIRHRQEREGWGFKTAEVFTNIETIIDTCETNGVFLLDSVTALLANEMFPESGMINHNAHEKVAGGIEEVLKRVNNIVLVSDAIFSDARIYEPLTETYRSGLAHVDIHAASLCDVVLEVCYGNIIAFKGENLYRRQLKPTALLPPVSPFAGDVK